MAEGKNSDTKIILMSQELMNLYEVRGPRKGVDFQPVTFTGPRECLEMMLNSEDDEFWLSEYETLDKTERLERQWGELELRLSFFSDAANWQ